MADLAVLRAAHDQTFEQAERRKVNGRSAHADTELQAARNDAPRTVRDAAWAAATTA